MATLQKFKFLATQCAVMGSPARSPTTSPVIHIRRRKTLRMLLGKGGGSGGSSTTAGAFQRRFLHQYRRDDSNSTPSDHRRIADNVKSSETPKQKSSNLGVRSKLKDLFVSSPPPAAEEDASERLLKDTGRSTGGGGGGEGVAQGGEMIVPRRVNYSGGGGIRPLSATLRQRLLMRRAWRPALVAIPEVSP